MRSMIYKSISVVLMIAVGMIIMAAHHEKENDDLASLKEAFNLNWESFKSADIETHYSTVHSAGGGISDRGRLNHTKDVDYEQVRGMAEWVSDNLELDIDNVNFNIQGNIAVVTYSITSTNKETGREGRGSRSDTWVRTDGKWLRLNYQTTPLTNDLMAMTQRSIEEVWNKGDLSVVDELFAADAVHTGPPSTGAVTNGIEERKQFITAVRTAFPDVKFTIDRGMLARANRVTVQWTITGTHQGEFMGIAATGKKVTNTGISIFTFAKGKIVDSYGMWDPLNLWRQLGVDPPQPPAADSSTAE